VCARRRAMSSADERLVDAAESGDVAEIERQIAAGANPNAFEETGDYTPLQRAAEYGHLAAIAALLKAGAHVEGVNSAGFTPLMYASCGRAAAIDALVAAGADVNHTSTSGDSALHWALMCGHLDAARALLEAGVRTDVRNENGEQPFDVVRTLPRVVARCGCAIVSRRCAAELPCAGLHVG
jgi:uncharacterized protein